MNQKSEKLVVRSQAADGRCLIFGHRQRRDTLNGGHRAGCVGGVLVMILSSACLFCGAGETRDGKSVSVTSDAQTGALESGGQATAKDPKANVAGGETKWDGAQRVLTSALDDKHKLAIGDRLSFRIEEDQEDPKPLTVTDSGDLELPYIGRFPAENKTCKQLAQEIKAALEKEYYYQATVIIAVEFMTKSRGKIYLVGPVRTPGPQDIPSDEVLTLSKAILRAGGFNDFADKRNVRVTRKGGVKEREKRTFVVDVGEIFEKGKVERDLALEPGDLILVPQRMIRF